MSFSLRVAGTADLGDLMECERSTRALLHTLSKLGLESAKWDLKECDNGFMKFGDVYVDEYVGRVKIGWVKWIE